MPLDRKARKPSRPPARLRLVRFSGSMLTYGVQDRSILGVRVRVTSRARTVVDCFRYRHKIGLDVALEALREAVCARGQRGRDHARGRGLPRRTIMPTYLESLRHATIEHVLPMGEERVMQADIAEKREALAALCRRYGVARLEVFGSGRARIGL